MQRKFLQKKQTVRSNFEGTQGDQQASSGTLIDSHGCDNEESGRRGVLAVVEDVKRLGRICSPPRERASSSRAAMIGQASHMASGMVE